MNLRLIRLIDRITGKRTLSDLDIEFHLFIGAIKMTSFSPISVDNKHRASLVTILVYLNHLHPYFNLVCIF